MLRLLGGFDNGGCNLQWFSWALFVAFFMPPLSWISEPPNLTEVSISKMSLQEMSEEACRTSYEGGDTGVFFVEVILAPVYISIHDLSILI